ncbi:pyridoxamine 5'-phosphate oxidase family protein [Paenibacillus sp. GCM10012307]|uniref:Pyridoxamine 5'-phosphate oxidase family protein n=1 Tax=Paenibacillus roseus TaxID=2798579 RepID=A0A934J1M3_9BACL|nr:pyridoxamine 5'-phosphate oxidase family protein [Paenibacillus roseus]MBJ6363137.1 pyridoxamine 5'-phosphate oxidase family protein [Paenibacillus roseus]
MTETTTVLSDSLLNQLKKDPFALLHTADAKDGSPTSDAISWIWPDSNERLRFGLDARSRLIANLKEKPEVCVTLFAPGTVQSLYGHVSCVTESLEAVPFQIACYEMKIESIKDAMFHGGRLCVIPEFEITYDKRAADKLDGQVFAAIRKA